jgi:hypothetical protein
MVNDRRFLDEKIGMNVHVLSAIVTPLFAPQSGARNIAAAAATAVDAHTGRGNTK